MAVITPPAASLRSSTVWIHGVRRDLVLATSWLPFAAVVVLLRPDGSALQHFATAVLVLSLLHQPITLALVYGDAEQFRRRRSLFVWSPVVLALLVFVGLQIDFLLVAVIGGLWNTHHTLMQRYGIVRIYRRKRPGSASTSGRLDLALLMLWLLTVLAWVAASPRTSSRIESLGLGTANERSLELLVDVRPYAVVLLALVGTAAVAVTGRWVRNEWQAGLDANPAMYLYVAATLLLFAVAAVHPVAGLLAWVGSHAIEYFLIVVTNLQSRAEAAGDRRRSVMLRASAGRLGIVGVVALVSSAGAGLVLLLQETAPLTAYAMVFFVIGGLHIFYDGLIWKLRRPTVASSFSIGASSVGS